MPCIEEHCQNSLRKYGKRFEDLHIWMDEHEISGKKPRLVAIIILLPIIASICNSFFIIDTAKLEGASKPSNWSMYQSDSQHTGYSEEDAPDFSQIRFIVNYTNNHQTYSSPIVVDGRLIICGGGYNYSLYCLNASSGELLWRAPQNFFSDATPAASGNRVIIPSSDGYLYCFDITNGTFVWKYRVSDGGYGNLPSPIIQDGMVFHAEGTTPFERLGGYIHALSLFEMEDGTTPKLIWKRFLNSSTTSSPAYSDGKVFLGYNQKPARFGGSTTHFVVALNATNGDLIWPYESGYGGRSSPTVVDGRVCFGAGPHVVCLNESSGEFLWKTGLRHDIYASPAVSDNRIFIGTLSSYAPNIPAVFYCINMSDGELEWEHETGLDRTIPSSPAVADGKVFVCAGRQIYAFNETDGEVVWTYETIGISAGCSPAVAIEGVYIFDQKGYVYSFGAPEFCRLVVFSEHGNVEGAGFYKVGDKATISVNSPIVIQEGVRYVFTGWIGDYISEEETAEITMNTPKTIVANWKLQYYLTVNSAQGNPQGEGWYDANSTAGFSVSSPDGLIILCWFKHWVDDSTSSSPSSSILMNDAKKVTAVWEPDYSRLFTIFATIALGFLIFALIRKRKRRT